MLKLEVGKIYTTEEGALYKIVTDKYKGYIPLSDSNPFLGVCLTGPGCKAFSGNGHSGGSFRLVKEYKEPVVKKKCFIILWFHPYGNLNPIRDQDVVSAQVYYGNGWIPVKGFEVEYNVPQSGD